MKTKSMKNIIFLSRHIGILLVLSVIIFAGCRSKTTPIFFYTLSPVQEADGQSDLNMTDQHQTQVSIGVGPVRLPDFLNTPRIATRNGTSRINYSEFHRWGGILDKDFLRVMSENLSVLLSTDQVKTYPWAGKGDPEIQVEFDVKQFDGEINDQVTLNVIWQVKNNSDNKRPMIVRRSILREPVNSVSKDDYEALVSAQSRVLFRLSEKIAKEITAQ